MTDRELLELAAKAAGVELHVEWTDAGPTGRYRNGADGDTWNPLTDDGDALRLAVKLRLDIDHHRPGVSVWAWVSGSATLGHYNEDTGNDLADTRRAIVRAAADVGKCMQ